MQLKCPIPDKLPAAYAIGISHIGIDLTDCRKREPSPSISARHCLFLSGVQRNYHFRYIAMSPGTPSGKLTISARILKPRG